MEMDGAESRLEQNDDSMDQNGSARGDYRDEELLDGFEGDVGEKPRESSKHRSKDRKKSRKEEKDHGSRDRERSKAADVSKESDKVVKDSEKDRVSSRERRKEDREDREKDRHKDKEREKDYDLDKYKDKDREKDKDRKDKGKDKDREREREGEKDHDRGREKERGKEKDRERDKERDRAKDRDREKERDKHKVREKEKEREREKEKERDKHDRDKAKDKSREKEREKDREKDGDKEGSKDKERDKMTGKIRIEGQGRGKDGGKDERPKTEGMNDGDVTVLGKETEHEDSDISGMEHNQQTEWASGPSKSELEERILRMKEERLKKKSEGASEVLAWVNKSRKLAEKRNVEKEKAMHLSKVFEEQDNIDEGESDDEEAARHTAKDLAGVKVRHGLDKVIGGGAVVLTLKDQNILTNGDINEEADVLENIEIGEQKQRDEAYKAAKKKTGIYEDKFSNEDGSQKKMLPQYDDPVEDEDVTLDDGGRFSAEAEKKIEELRKRILGVSASNHSEDLNSSGKISSDYYTHDEILQFKKPKKKKSLRKKEKLDLDALEAEAITAGLGMGDLGSRKDGKRKAAKEDQEKSEAEIRNNAYQTAYAKAEEASKALRQEQTLTVKVAEDENPVFGEDDEDLYKSLETARKLALKKQNQAAASGPQAVALLASTANNQSSDDHNSAYEEPQENKVVFTEMEEFVWGLQLDEEAHKTDDHDVFMDEDEVPKSSDQEKKDEAGGWMEVKDTDKDEHPINEEKEEIVLDETIHEAAVGKGLSGALKLLKERGTLKETVDLGGRNMDKKKSKLVGIYDNDGRKEIRIERTDEFGRIMTPKEAFRVISHKFHGKGPGKTKQEKRMKQYQEELKLKQMKNSDTPSLSVERMREAQARLKTPYLVLSGHVKPGQTSDPRSGFATVEKDLAGGLTPMLGDKKVSHSLVCVLLLFC
ncbi:SART-1 family protein DOT2 isoform X2 [Telopea speciosissima]|uniref:SART-1 family protein DOT2 isoform X2 n=1 Tax=Telopea speciosissima TaxID=54955 RepID=UPI001CC3E31C|nr:SART-1 family protein DOT2 isoform X2 [Telopea speciosissima]